MSSVSENDDIARLSELGVSESEALRPTEQDEQFRELMERVFADIRLDYETNSKYVDAPLYYVRTNQDLGGVFTVLESTDDVEFVGGGDESVYDEMFQEIQRQVGQYRNKYERKNRVTRLEQEKTLRQLFKKLLLFRKEVVRYAVDVERSGESVASALPPKKHIISRYLYYATILSYMDVQKMPTLAAAARQDTTLSSTWSTTLTEYEKEFQVMFHRLYNIMSWLLRAVQPNGPQGGRPCELGSIIDTLKSQPGIRDGTNLDLGALNTFYSDVSFTWSRIHVDGMEISNDGVLERVPAVRIRGGEGGGRARGVGNETLSKEKVIDMVNRSRSKTRERREAMVERLKTNIKKKVQEEIQNKKPQHNDSGAAVKRKNDAVKGEIETRITALREKIKNALGTLDGRSANDSRNAKMVRDSLQDLGNRCSSIESSLTESKKHIDKDLAGLLSNMKLNVNKTSRAMRVLTQHINDCSVSYGVVKQGEKRSSGAIEESNLSQQSQQSPRRTIRRRNVRGRK